MDVDEIPVPSDTDGDDDTVLLREEFSDDDGSLALTPSNSSTNLPASGSGPGSTPKKKKSSSIRRQLSKRREKAKSIRLFNKGGEKLGGGEKGLVFIGSEDEGNEGNDDDAEEGESAGVLMNISLGGPPVHEEKRRSLPFGINRIKSRDKEMALDRRTSLGSEQLDVGTREDAACPSPRSNSCTPGLATQTSTNPFCTSCHLCGTLISSLELEAHLREHIQSLIDECEPKSAREPARSLSKSDSEVDSEEEAAMALYEREMQRKKRGKRSFFTVYAVCKRRPAIFLTSASARVEGEVADFYPKRRDLSRPPAAPTTKVNVDKLYDINLAAKPSPVPPRRRKSHTRVGSAGCSDSRLGVESRDTSETSVQTASSFKASSSPTPSREAVQSRPTSSSNVENIGVDELHDSSPKTLRIGTVLDTESNLETEKVLTPAKRSSSKSSSNKELMSSHKENSVRQKEKSSVKSPGVVIRSLDTDGNPSLEQEEGPPIKMDCPMCGKYVEHVFHHLHSCLVDTEGERERETERTKNKENEPEQSQAREEISYFSQLDETGSPPHCIKVLPPLKAPLPRQTPFTPVSDEALSCVDELHVHVKSVPPAAFLASDVEVDNSAATSSVAETGNPEEKQEELGDKVATGEEPKQSKESKEFKSDFKELKERKDTKDVTESRHKRKASSKSKSHVEDVKEGFKEKEPRKRSGKKHHISYQNLHEAAGDLEEEPLQVLDARNTEAATEGEPEKGWVSFGDGSVGASVEGDVLTSSRSLPMRHSVNANDDLVNMHPYLVTTAVSSIKNNSNVTIMCLDNFLFLRLGIEGKVYADARSGNDPSCTFKLRRQLGDKLSLKSATAVGVPQWMKDGFAAKNDLIHRKGRALYVVNVDTGEVGLSDGSRSQQLNHFRIIQLADS